MGIEIERKFRVRGGGWESGPAVEVRQGYLNLDPCRTVRVRCAGDRGFLTVKGMAEGIARKEFEYEIPLADARALLAMCEGAIVEKLRRRVPYGGRTWDVDEFLGANRGLVLAEVEIEDEAAAVERPPWAGEEVTSDPRYYNARLAVEPYASFSGPAEVRASRPAGEPPAQEE